MKHDLDSIKNAANLRIMELLTLFGFENPINRYNYINCKCVHEGSNNITAFSFHIDLGVWQCFTKGCQKEWGSDVIGLIRLGLNKQGKSDTFKDALEFLKKFLGDNWENAKLEDEMAFVKANRITKRTQQRKYEESVLNKLKPHKYLLDRGFSKETIANFQIGYCDDKTKKFNNRIVIPIRDCDGAIVGFTARWVGDHLKDGVAKWLHSNGFRKGDNLFNLKEALPHVRKSGQIIITEGPLDAMKLYEYGYKNAVAIFGTSVSSIQKSIILGNATSVIFIFDNDASGKAALQDVAVTFKEYVDLYKCELPEGKDVDELEIDNIRKIMENRIKI